MLDVLGHTAHARDKRNAYRSQSTHQPPRGSGARLLRRRLLRPASPPIALRRLRLATQQPIELIDITDDVAAQIREVGQRDGLVTIFSRHTTAAIRIQEDEPLLRQDLCDFLARCAPSQTYYRHNDFAIRTEHMHPDESPNGHAHCLHLLLGSSETVPVSGGELQLGTWQRLFLVELDGPRPDREVWVQLQSVAP